MGSTAIRIVVVGAGPVGLALALQAARALPLSQVCVFDARPPERDIGADPRTLALSQGSLLLLRRLVTLGSAQPILEVHVSQQPPSFGDAAVRISAAEEGVPQLGAVFTYGAIVAPLQRAWQAAVAAEPARLALRLGCAVKSLRPLPGGVEVESAQGAEGFDLAVLAEGGIFGEQAKKGFSRDYRQTAWVGRATLEGLAPGLAIERFTRSGPAALLPLGPGRAALAWCVSNDDDPVAGLDNAGRIALLASIFPPEAGRLVELSELKPFALGLNAERTLVQGRQVRIGNAAQTLHPVAGQGLNLGLRDAYALVGALRRRSDLEAALRHVEWTRAADRWPMIVGTDLLARGFTWQAPGLAAARGLALAALQAAPPARHWLARRMMFGLR